ncbi:TetR family transcriptional regulator [Planococcus antarcticus DSM 14505]|uniref:TetR family transcriptional regulator n=1 Tax=Planococcus antarcticus DSM 14505 TaxID=1185653 RepID=A0ABM6D4V1_9BACL|nr:TetR/AcrR family transcriptional regulator [Planococcus antarcticus]ANU10736.1 TetR family transcriptional regulator [Planococcus antarcticus DSM 14505]
MKADLILQTAISHFAKEGYEGASLSKIAEEVGIKKPSIYAHYKGKDNLFLSALQYSFHTQKIQLASYFDSMREESLESLLLGYFEWLAKESRDNERTKFILRVAYFPPLKLEKEVGELFNPFFDTMHQHLTRILRERHRYENVLHSVDFSNTALAYLTVIEGTMSELVYSGIERYEKRLQAIWPIFWRGLIN